MVRDVNEFVQSCIESTKLGVTPDSRLVARVGDNGAEHAVEHVKVRQNFRTGRMEMILQISERPNEQ
jgi:hypothetical protein